MIITKKIKFGKKCIEALMVKLQKKNLIVLRGKNGYIMCGYLNLKAAQKINDVAVMIKGVSTINDALKTQVHSCTSAAKCLGIKDGQPIKEILVIIA
ncbi:MAG: DUF1805 domain-containing protein [Candidatus Omnitrophota bacterium]|jgi:uncharacterized protein YunC (DUF1805 family)